MGRKVGAKPECIGTVHRTGDAAGWRPSACVRRPARDRGCRDETAFAAGVPRVGVETAARRSRGGRFAIALALLASGSVDSLFSMTPHVSIALGLGLLLLPLWSLRARNSRLVGFEQRAWPSGARSVALTIVDVVRAALGAGLLIRHLPELQRFEWLGHWQDATALAVAATGGLLVQTLVWRDDDFSFAPVFYGLGLAAVVAHPIVLAISLPLALGGALALRAWAGGFLGAGAGLAAVGLAVEQQDWRRSLLMGLVLCSPVLVSVLAGRHLGSPKK